MLNKSIIVLLVFATCAYAHLEYRPLGQFEVELPAYINFGFLTREDAQNQNQTMIITTFSGSPRVSGKLYTVNNIGSMLNSVDNISPTLITGDLVWPNEARAVPEGIFSQPAIGLGDGFLPPGKKTGSVTVVSMDDNTPHQISPTKKNWFYHVALWWDMNGDGIEDCISARCNVPTIGAIQGEMVWFENPGGDFFEGPWQEHVIADGPDIMIHTIWIDEDPNRYLQPQIIAAEFFSEAITLWWTEDNALWSNDTYVQSRIIDDTMGAPFDVQFIDLNGDGRKDILATNHQGSANESAVFAYTVPVNWKTDPWPRYVLATNITTLIPGPNQASPGKAVAFHPNTQETDTKPYILVGGDGSEYAYMLYPDSEDPNNWSYTREEVVFTDCTVGQVAVADVDNDGMVEFFVPAYENGIVYAYTFGQ